MPPTSDASAGCFVLRGVAGVARRTVYCSPVLSLFLAASLGAASPVYVLIVANNQSNDPRLATLKFADDDGARYFTALTPMAQGRSKTARSLWPILWMVCQRQ